MTDSPEFWPISGVNLSVSIIHCYDGKRLIASASGFFFCHNGTKYLVTNRHVVVDENDGYRPDSLTIKLHSNRANPKENVIVPIALYDKNNQQLWLEHPNQAILQCDVVLVPLLQNNISSALMNFMTVANIPNKNIGIQPFSDVVVVGYPLGFHDELNNLPIYRQGMIASPYPSMFEDKPYFLIDAKLHSGSSGSAVLNSPHNLLTRGVTGFHSNNAIVFGIFSADFSIGDDPLGLNIVWYSYLLPEIATACIS